MTIIETIENLGRALKVEELSAMTSISRKTLYRLISTRKLPAFRIGGSVRLDPTTTANWLRSRLS
jgi:excisionase family DNA binding protein